MLFGEPLTNPSDIVDRVDNTWLTIIAAPTFFAATVGINLVAFIVGALWVSVISHLGLAMFVDTLGALLAPLYGIGRSRRSRSPRSSRSPRCGRPRWHN